MRRAGPASRAFGRYAVGLRPILDPDPYLGAPKTPADNPKEDQPGPTVGLTRPRSFRNDKSEARWSSKVLIAGVWVPDHLNLQWRRCPMCGTMIDLDRPDQSCPRGELSPLRRSYL